MCCWQVSSWDSRQRFIVVLSLNEKRRCVTAVSWPTCTQKGQLSHQADHLTGLHYPEASHLGMALCPWSPALSAGCQRTRRLTWWWSGRTGRPRGLSTWWGTWLLKEARHVGVDSNRVVQCDQHSVSPSCHDKKCKLKIPHIPHIPQMNMFCSVNKNHWASFTTILLGIKKMKTCIGECKPSWKLHKRVTSFLVSAGEWGLVIF